MGGDVRRLIRQVRSWPGWEVREIRRGGSHSLHLLPPDREHPPIVMHLSESDHRAMANTRARLRRAGAPL